MAEVIMYGLLGRTLSHSFSPQIHSLLGNNDYRLFETGDLEVFFKARKFLGINVTIPFKEVVAPYLDEVDAVAKRTGSVNTILNRNGKLIGADTDYVGLAYLLRHHNLDVLGKAVVILGNGGVAKTTECLLNDLKAASIFKLARTPKTDNELHFSDLDKVKECDIIINTTPVGMYPHNDDVPLVNIRMFPKVEAVVDLVYNPLRTSLVLDAESHKIKTASGLVMLVAQAKASHDLFFGKTTPDKEIDRICNTLYRKMLNIVFIGMPMSGKSLYARALNNKYNKQLIDTDKKIETLEKLSASEIFESKGEPYFRDLEFALVKSFYKDHGLMVSTGGGMIQNPMLMNMLRQNGVVVFIDKDKEALAKRQFRTRPLIKNIEDLARLYDKRHPLYEKYADVSVKIPVGDDYHHQLIEEKINEYLSGKRT